MAKFDPRGRKVKILATLGPASRSPEMIELRRGDDEALWLVQTTNRLAYEIRSERPVLANH